MKKILFATTALIATASVAAAEVKFSGYGRFGLDYNDANSKDKNDPNYNGVSETNITSRLRLQVDMSTETDAGVGFNARFRAEAESRDNKPNGAEFNGPRFGVSYEGISVNVGNIVGAIDNTPGTYLETRTAGIGIDGAGFVSHVGNVNDEAFNWDTYSSGGTGANGVEVIYGQGGFTAHLSYSTDNDTLPVPAKTATVVVAPGTVNSCTTGQCTVELEAAKPGKDGEDRLAFMLAYTFDNFTVSAAHQNSGNMWEDKTIVTAAYSGDTWGVRAAYADNDGIDKWGLYGNVDIGAASNILLFVTSEGAVDQADVTAGRTDNRDIAGQDGSEGESYGIHLHHDLGGGVSLEAGYRRSSADNDTFQAGAYFAF